MGIGSVLLVITGIGGLALRTKRRTPIQSGDCGGGQLAGQPRVVVTGLSRGPSVPASMTSGAATTPRGSRTPDGGR
jgi:hypothetical protein